MPRELNIEMLPVVAPPPPPPTGLANLFGIVRDAQTGQPVVGVQMRMRSSETARTDTYTASTDASGFYQFLGIPPSVSINPYEYVVLFEKESYWPLLGYAVVSSGDNRRLDMTLIPIGFGPPSVAHLATLFGRVTDAQTLQPLNDVAVSLSAFWGTPAPVVTVSSGDYLILNIRPLTAGVRFTKAGYKGQLILHTFVAYEIFELNVQLVPTMM